MPCISIVLPTHNGSRYLSLAIDSVLSQTYEDFELIIVDDGSTDNTWEIISYYAGVDSRIKALRHETNKNLPAALNTGFKNATGELFTWTSDDNILYPHMFGHFIDFFSCHQEADIVYSDYNNIDENGIFLGRMKTGLENELPIYDNIGASFMYRRKVDTVCGGYDENRFCSEDYAFWLKAYHNEFCFCKLEESLYQYRIHKNSLTGQRLSKLKEQTLRLLMENNKENADKIPDLIRLRSYLRCVRLAKDLENQSLAQECLCYARSIRANADDWTRPELVRYASGEPCTQKRLILFGAGKNGVSALTWMRENGIAVSAFVDNNEELWHHEIEGIPVLKPSFLKDLESPKVIITTAHSLIASQLSSMGIENYSSFIKDDRCAYAIPMVKNKNARILEVGPLNRPIFTKDQYPNCFYCDVRTTEEIKTLYLGNEYLETTGLSVDVNTILDIDFVLKESYSSTFTDIEKFDCVVMSHVIEHVDDILYFLDDVVSALKPGGLLIIVYPDKRFCFDHYRQEASFRDAFEVNQKGYKANARMVFDFLFNVIQENSAPVFWQADQMEKYLPSNSFESARSAYHRLQEGSREEDVHYWPFSDAGFLKFLYDCTRASMLKFSCIDFTPTAENTQQFFVTLQYDETIPENIEKELENLRNMAAKIPIEYRNSKQIYVEKQNAFLQHQREIMESQIESLSRQIEELKSRIKE